MIKCIHNYLKLILQYIFFIKGHVLKHEVATSYINIRGISHLEMQARFQDLQAICWKTDRLIDNYIFVKIKLKMSLRII